MHIWSFAKAWRQFVITNKHPNGNKPNEEDTITLFCEGNGIQKQNAFSHFVQINNY